MRFLSLRRLRPIVPPVASAALYCAAFPPYNFLLLVFVALVPWLVQLRSLDGRQAFKSGLAFGAVFWLVQMYWLVPFVGRWTGSYLLSLIPWLLCPVLAAWYFGLTGWLMQRCLATNRLWLLPLAWAAVEVFRSYIPGLAYPWGLLASPLWKMPPLIQGASYGLIYGVSAWVALINVCVALLFYGSIKGAEWLPRRKVASYLIVAAGVLLLSVARYQEPPKGKRRIITIGQTGVNMAFLPEAEQQARIPRATQLLFLEAVRQGSDLLLLPEGIVRADSGLPPSTSFQMPPPVSTIFGGQRTENTPMGSRRHQSAFAYDGAWRVADKTRLVIFGEFVPFRNVLPFLRSFNLPNGDLDAGERISSLPVGNFVAGPLICFEALFPDLALRQERNGANLLCVISIDDWYEGAGAQEQLAGASVWRAVESGLPLARAATTGVSMGIDARGNIAVQAPRGVTTALRYDALIPSAGDAWAFRWLFPVVSVAGAVWLLIESVFLRFRRR